MFCTHCGKSIPDGAKFCPECGAAISAASGSAASNTNNNSNFNNVQYSSSQNQQYGYNYPPYTPVRPVDAPNAGFLALGLFFPLVGFILWLVWRDDLPLRAKSAGKGALIGVCIYVGIILLVVLCLAIFVGAAVGGVHYYSHW